MSLAVSLELPLLLVDIQRGGPSTGLPTKTEAADLNIAMYGRHGEAPLPIVAAYSPSNSRVNPMLGIGIRFDMTKKIGLRAEFEHYNNVGEGGKTLDQHLDEREQEALAIRARMERSGLPLSDFVLLTPNGNPPDQ